MTSSDIKEQIKKLPCERLLKFFNLHQAASARLSFGDSNGNVFLTDVSKLKCEPDQHGNSVVAASNKDGDQFCRVLHGLSIGDTTISVTSNNINYRWNKEHCKQKKQDCLSMSARVGDDEYSTVAWADGEKQALHWLLDPKRQEKILLCADNLIDFWGPVGSPECDPVRKALKK